MQGSTVLTERVGDVGVVTLNRPEKLNALNRTLMEDLEAAIRASEEDGVRALLLTGAGRGFCSGADLTAPKGEGHISGNETLFKKDLPLGYLSLLLREFPRPTVAAVNGPAVGAGLGLALACDIRVASQSAKFSAIFAKRALTPDYGCTQLLPMAVGMSKAMELMYTGDIIDAAEAERIGLVSCVTSDDEFSERAMDLAQKLASGPSVAHELTKRLAYSAPMRTLREQLWMEGQSSQISGMSEDRAEGQRAFIERREPVFRGR